MADTVSCRHRRVIRFIKNLQKRKSPHSPNGEQGQKSLLRYHLVCRKSGLLTTVPTHRPPLTQAIRHRILWKPISPCPRRPICCSAFRSDLSPRNSLWMRWQFYFRVVGLSLIGSLNNRNVRLSRTFFHLGWSGLPF